MTLFAALKTGRALGRPKTTFQYCPSLWTDTITYVAPGTLIYPEFLLEMIRLRKDDILATDWIVEKPKKAKRK